MTVILKLAIFLYGHEICTRFSEAKYHNRSFISIRWLRYVWVVIIKFILNTKQTEMDLINNAVSQMSRLSLDN